MNLVRRLSLPQNSRTVAVSAHHLLLVDDDPQIRGTIASLLGRAGYRVDCAADGEDGWTALRSDHFDLLITDHDMPRLSGLELLRKLRASLFPLPAIMISGFMPWGEEDLPRLLHPGAVIEKPFRFAVLLAHVKALLSGGPDGPATASPDGCPPARRPNPCPYPSL